MAGFRPNEGRELSGNMLLKNITTDRGTDLELGLFTTPSPTATITEATIAEPSGGGYARIVLDDATWTEAAEVFNYVKQTFTANGGDWTNVVGYFIATRGATKRLLAVEVNPTGIVSVTDGNEYSIAPQMTVL